MTQTPPPVPGPPYPPQPGQWPPAPPPKSRRGLVIGLIVGGAIAVLLCAGCVTVGIAFYVTNGTTEPDAASDTPSASVATPPPGADSTACGVTNVAAEPASNAVGLPPFAGARRSGPATMRITTNLGTLTIAMDRAATPCTVASFEHLAAKHYFDNSPCHRLTTEGMGILQCGDPTGTGEGRPDYAFTDENLTGARYTRGVVAMANAGPNTNGGQFFIVYVDGELSPLYTPFGTVTSGLDIVDKVAAGGHDNSITAGGGKPRVTLTFQQVTVE